MAARALTLVAPRTTGWWFDEELENDDTQVAVTHLATRVVTVHATMSDAHDFIARPDVLNCLAAQTVGVIDGIADPADKAEARLALVKLLGYGALLPASVEAEHRCRCGGYLAFRGRMAHIDTCPDEVAGGICPGEGDHKTCTRDWVMQCEHPACTNRNRVYALDCLYGHEFCCGCCHGGD